MPRVTAARATRGRNTGSPALVLVLACALGVFLGLGLFTFRYAKGLSYFSTDPSACVNCHIMQSQYASWQRSSHHAQAVCIDCHLPADFVPKYIAKAENGYRHAERFTSGNFAEPIFVQPRGAEILEENCIRCHGALVADMRAGSSGHAPGIACVHCHAGVGHGEPARLGGPFRADVDR
jgi:cytochrome c nitrite reductase small subunit